MLLFKRNVNYRGFGIAEKLWAIIVCASFLLFLLLRLLQEPNIEKALGITPFEYSLSLSLSLYFLFVSSTILILFRKEMLRLVPTLVQPQEKLDCISDAIALFDW